MPIHHLSLALHVNGQSVYSGLVNMVHGKRLGGWEMATGKRHEKDLKTEIINLYPSLHALFDSTTLQHLTLQREVFFSFVRRAVIMSFTMISLRDMAHYCT